MIANKQKKELLTALKKNYSVMSQALVRADYDLGETITPKEYYNLKLMPAISPYLKILQDCNTSSCIGYTNIDDGSGGTLTYVVKNYRTYNKKKNIQTNYFDDGQFVLNDGSMILIENPVSPYHIFITVDVNGIKKNPNVWGQDLFTFQLMNDGKLLPMGQEGTEYSSDEYCSLSSSNALNGIGCAYKALTDENYWKYLP